MSLYNKIIQECGPDSISLNGKVVIKRLCEKENFIVLERSVIDILKLNREQIESEIDCSDLSDVEEELNSMIVQFIEDVEFLAKNLLIHKELNSVLDNLPSAKKGNKLREGRYFKMLEKKAEILKVAWDQICKL